MKILPSRTQCKRCKANIEYTSSDLQEYEIKYFICPVCGTIIYPDNT